MARIESELNYLEEQRNTLNIFPESNGNIIEERITSKQDQIMSKNANEEHIRHCMLYEFNQGLSACQAAKRINTAYPGVSLNYRKCQTWFRKFRQGKFELKDSARSGRPRRLDDVMLRQVVEQEPTLSISQISERLNSKWSTVQHHLAMIGMVNRNGKWVRRNASGVKKTDGTRLIV